MRNLLIIMIIGIIFMSCKPQLKDSYSNVEAISFIATGVADTTSQTIPVVDELSNVISMRIITIDGVPFYPGMSNGGEIRYYKADKYLN